MGLRVRAGATAFGAALTGAFAVSAQQPAPETTVMIVELRRGAHYVGLPRVCPGATGNETEGEGLCLAELYEGWASRVRHLSGPRLDQRVRLRMTAHARTWPPGTRLLVTTIPFRDGEVTGQFALWWHLPDVDGHYCMSNEDLEEWEDSPTRRVFLQGRRHHFRPPHWDRARDFHCIHA